jgi:hypothetical protein
MSKWLMVVALVLLVLTGAMGLRNMVVANATTMSAFHGSAPAIWANGPGPFPPPPPPGGHVRANGPGPFPPPPPPGGHVRANGPGPFPPPPPPGGHVRAYGPAN